MNIIIDGQRCHFEVEVRLLRTEDRVILAEGDSFGSSAAEAFANATGSLLENAIKARDE